MRSAPEFQLTMAPVSVWLMMASSDASTMAANCAWARLARTVVSGGWVCIRDLLAAGHPGRLLVALPDGQHRIDGFEKGIEEVGVEMLCPSPYHGGDGLLDRERRAVHPVIRERVEDVRNGHDPAFDRDCLLHEPGRVALAVPPLVMRERDHRSERQDGGVRILQELVAHERMPLHHRTLIGSGWAGLLQDRIGNADLADVVQGGSEAHSFVVRCLEPGAVRQQCRVLAHPADVCPGFLVADGQGCGQSLD